MGSPHIVDLLHDPALGVSYIGTPPFCMSHDHDGNVVTQVSNGVSWCEKHSVAETMAKQDVMLLVNLGASFHVKIRFFGVQQEACYIESPNFQTKPSLFEGFGFLPRFLRCQREQSGKDGRRNWEGQVRSICCG